MVVLAITSQTQGSYSSDEAPYGAGKTTLAMRIAREYSHFDGELQRFDRVDAEDHLTQTEEGWEAVKDWTFDDPRKLRVKLDGVLERRGRVNVAIWDDTEVEAPSESGKSRKIVEMVRPMHRWRTCLGLLILTCPHMGAIHSSVASLVQYEAMIYKEGKYELQMYHFTKDWRHNPMKSRAHMEKLSGNYSGEVEFGPLPPGIQKWYDEWRTQRMLGIAATPAPKPQTPQERGLAW